jgi:phage terminase large subunit
MRYPSIFIRQTLDGMSETAESKLGFRTDMVSRPLIIAELTEYVREHTELIQDRIVLREMLDFVRNDKGRPEAREGRHDDLVIAYAIAVHVRRYARQTRFEDEPEGPNGITEIAEYGL